MGAAVQQGGASDRRDRAGRRAPRSAGLPHPLRLGTQNRRAQLAALQPARQAGTRRDRRGRLSRRPARTAEGRDGVHDVGRTGARDLDPQRRRESVQRADQRHPRRAASVLAPSRNAGRRAGRGPVPSDVPEGGPALQRGGRARVARADLRRVRRRRGRGIAIRAARECGRVFELDAGREPDARGRTGAAMGSGGGVQRAARGVSRGRGARVVRAQPRSGARAAGQPDELLRRGLRAQRRLERFLAAADSAQPGAAHAVRGRVAPGAVPPAGTDPVLYRGPSRPHPPWPGYATSTR